MPIANTQPLFIDNLVAGAWMTFVEASPEIFFRPAAHWLIVDRVTLASIE
jgi:hypothetical protein